MDDAKHIFIINPAAGRSDQTAPVAGVIGELLRRRALDYEILITEAPKHATRLVAEAAARAGDRPLRFYACGGDGTLNEVATAVVRIPNAACTHFPTGSGNDFIKIFGSDMADPDLLRRAREELLAATGGKPAGLSEKGSHPRLR